MRTVSPERKLSGRHVPDISSFWQDHARLRQRRDGEARVQAEGDMRGKFRLEVLKFEGHQ